MTSPEMEPPDDDEVGDRAEWLHHGYTERLLKRAIADRNKSLAALINDARRSADPLIIQAYAKYEHANLMCLMLQGKDRKGSDER